MIDEIFYNNRRISVEMAIRILRSKIEVYKMSFIDLSNYERAEVGKDIIYLMSQILSVADENKKHNSRYRLPI